MFYLDLFKCLARHQVRYILVGGLAMNLHGVPRMTMDIDLVLVLDEENLRSFMTAAAEMGLKPALPVKVEDLLDSELRKSWVKAKNMIAFPFVPGVPGGPTIDILIDPPLDVELALSRAEYRSLGDVCVPVASIEDMIQLKADTGRIQDLADVEHLHRIQSRDKQR